MKGKLTSTLVAGATVFSLVMVGCSNAQSASTSTSEQPAQQQSTASVAEQAPAQSAEKSQSTAQSTAVQAQSTSQTQATVQVSEADAKKTALDAAGVSEQDVTNFRCNLDMDDGVAQYEISFHVGQTEYDYDIDANTGAILEQSSEVETNGD